MSYDFQWNMNSMMRFKRNVSKGIFFRMHTPMKHIKMS